MDDLHWTCGRCDDESKNVMWYRVHHIFILFPLRGNERWTARLLVCVCVCVSFVRRSVRRTVSRKANEYLCVAYSS